MKTEDVPWMPDVNEAGYYTSGSIYKRVVGKYADGTDKTQACEPSAPVWFDRYQCLVSELIQLHRADIDL